MTTDVVFSALLMIAVLLARRYLFVLTFVKGGSMRPAVENREVLFVSRLAHIRRRPRRGEVVICHYPGRYLDRWKLMRQCFVKRVIGLPGETVEICEGTVLVNGEPLEEGYLDPMRNRRGRSMPLRTLGAEEYFVLGDNRDSSNDSRSVGPIRQDMIVGRAMCVIWPVRAWRRLDRKG